MAPEYNSLFQSMKRCMSHSTFSAFSGLVWVIPVLHVRQLRPKEPMDLPQVTGPGGGTAAPTDPTSVLLPSTLVSSSSDMLSHTGGGVYGEEKACTVTEAML